MGSDLERTSQFSKFLIPSRKKIFIGLFLNMYLLTYFAEMVNSTSTVRFCDTAPGKKLEFDNMIFPRNL